VDQQLSDAIAAREEFLAPLRARVHDGAFRLFDGFREGDPRYVLDVYGTTLVVFDHAESSEAGDEALQSLVASVLERLPFLRTVLRKPKAERDPDLRKGTVIHGAENDLCRRIQEHGVRYAIRLRMHHDASFYLDTRNLRALLLDEMKDKRLFNAFAFTGSLGVAARAAPAAAVVQTDKRGELLNVAKDSYALNGFPIARSSFIAGDYFEVTSRLRRSEQLYDCVVIDPPFFAESPRGRVDLEASLGRLLDKARPLVADGGRLIVVNNALYVSGAELVKTLEGIAGGGYAEVERFVDVPSDCAPRSVGSLVLPADPAPFNHPTKIAVLRIKRRDGRS